METKRSHVLPGQGNLKNIKTPKLYLKFLFIEWFFSVKILVLATIGHDVYYEVFVSCKGTQSVCVPNKFSQSEESINARKKMWLLTRF